MANNVVIMSYNTISLHKSTDNHSLQQISEWGPLVMRTAQKMLMFCGIDLIDD